MSELLAKMNQQFTDMHKLAIDFAAMAEQAIIERDKARERVTRLEGALRDLIVAANRERIDPLRMAAAIKNSRHALEGK